MRPNDTGDKDDRSTSGVSHSETPHRAPGRGRRGM